MSNLIVEVCEVADVLPHPNADRLEIAIVKGWQTVIGKGQFSKGDKVVYFPPDTLLHIDWTDSFAVTKYCSELPNEPDFDGMRRIRKTRLRGEPSFGLIVPAEDSMELGQDVASHYTALKYEPPVKLRGGDQEKDHPLFVNYCEVENLRNYPNIFSPGEHVYVTEKIHGTNCKIGMINGQEMAGSRRTNRRRPEDLKTSFYWFPWALQPVATMMKALSVHAKVVILYGEVFGKVQSLHYGKSKDIDFLAFDLYLDGKFVSVERFWDLTSVFGVPTVPSFGYVPYSLERIKELASGKSFVEGADHVKEGVVIKPLEDRHEPKLGRVVMKYLSDEYLLSKHMDRDTTDV